MNFDAWALPEWVAGPSSRAVEMAGPSGVRRLDASVEWVAELAAGLIGMRDPLLGRSAQELAGTIGRVAERFLDPGDPLREEALAHLPGTSGLSPEMCSAVLDGMAVDWSAERLQELVEVEFGEPPALDGFVQGSHGSVRAMGSPLTTQVVAGSVPGVGATAMIRSLLVKSPTLIKPGLGDLVLPVLLARALTDADVGLGNAVAVVYWPGDREDLTAEAVRAAGTVVAYGGDQAVAAVRGRTPATARFVAYHHRVSVCIVGRAALSRDRLREAASEVAGAVAFFDQRGCVSPQIIYVEAGGEVDASGFAHQVAEAMAVVEANLPGGRLGTNEAASLQQVRGTAEVLAASGGSVELHHGDSKSWTVILDPEGSLTVQCVGRVVRLVPVAQAEEVPALLVPLSGHLQTVGLTGCGDRSQGLADALARTGVTRITDLAGMAFPPPWWHHDGRGPLRELVDWVDIEGWG